MLVAAFSKETLFRILKFSFTNTTLIKHQMHKLSTVHFSYQVFHWSDLHTGMDLTQCCTSSTEQFRFSLHTWKPGSAVAIATETATVQFLWEGHLEWPSGMTPLFTQPHQSDEL